MVLRSAHSKGTIYFAIDPNFLPLKNPASRIINAKTPSNADSRMLKMSGAALILICQMSIAAQVPQSERQMKNKIIFSVKTYGSGLERALDGGYWLAEPQGKEAWTLCLIDSTGQTQATHKYPWKEKIKSSIHFKSLGRNQIGILWLANYSLGLNSKYHLIFTDNEGQIVWQRDSPISVKRAELLPSMIFLMGQGQTQIRISNGENLEYDDFTPEEKREWKIPRFSGYPDSVEYVLPDGTYLVLSIKNPTEVISRMENQQILQKITFPNQIDGKSIKPAVDGIWDDPQSGGVFVWRQIEGLLTWHAWPNPRVEVLALTPKAPHWEIHLDASRWERIGLSGRPFDHYTLSYYQQDRIMAMSVLPMELTAPNETYKVALWKMQGERVVKPVLKGKIAVIEEIGNPPNPGFEWPLFENEIPWKANYLKDGGKILFTMIRPPPKDNHVAEKLEYPLQMRVQKWSAERKPLWAQSFEITWEPTSADVIANRHIALAGKGGALIFDLETGALKSDSLLWSGEGAWVGPKAVVSSLEDRKKIQIHAYEGETFQVSIEGLLPKSEMVTKPHFHGRTINDLDLLPSPDGSWWIFVFETSHYDDNTYNLTEGIKRVWIIQLDSTGKNLIRKEISQIVKKREWFPHARIGSHGIPPLPLVLFALIPGSGGIWRTKIDIKKSIHFFQPIEAHSDHVIWQQSQGEIYSLMKGEIRRMGSLPLKNPVMIYPISKGQIVVWGRREVAVYDRGGQILKTHPIQEDAKFWGIDRAGKLYSIEW